MIDETIQRIEARLRGAESLPDQTRAELLLLLATLKSEVGQLPAAHSAAAREIARAADASTSEALASERDDESHRKALAELAGSVREFEDSHPQLVQVVNSIASALSRMGI